MRSDLLKNYYDSEITERGTKRKRIYTNRGTWSGDQSAKNLALREFRANKKDIYRVEVIEPFNRRHNNYDEHHGDTYLLKNELLDFLLDNARIF